jgi:hypothetical protein
MVHRLQLQGQPEFIRSLFQSPARKEPVAAPQFCDGSRLVNGDRSLRVQAFGLGYDLRVIKAPLWKPA